MCSEQYPATERLWHLISGRKPFRSFSIPCMNVDQAAFHLLAPFTDMPMRCLPEFSFKQFSSAIIFQHTHLLDGYPVQSHEPFALRYALVYEYGIRFSILERQISSLMEA